MSPTAAGARRAQPQYGSIASTASEATRAAALAVPHSTLVAAAMLPRYTTRNSVVGSITSEAVLTSLRPSSVMSTSPAAATASRNTGERPVC